MHVYPPPPVYREGLPPSHPHHPLLLTPRLAELRVYGILRLALLVGVCECVCASQCVTWRILALPNCLLCVRTHICVCHIYRYVTYMCMHIYVYVTYMCMSHICVCTYMCMYTATSACTRDGKTCIERVYIERKRERKREKVCECVCV